MMNPTDYDDVLEAYPADIEASLAEIAELREQMVIESEGLEFLVDDLQNWMPGSKVRVAFLGGSSTLHHKIAEVVGDIDESCSLTFDFGYDASTDTYRTWSLDDSDYAAEIRVSFDLPGYFSLVGTDSMNPTISMGEARVGGRPNQRSLNLSGFDARLPSTWRGTVLHEFLHAVAFLHEHQNPRAECQADFRWEDDEGYEHTTDTNGQVVADSANRRPGIYSFLAGAPNNWDKSRIDHNLRADPEKGASSSFDADSVMLYRFPPLFYKSDPSPCAPTSDGQTLSEGDKRGLALLYPESAEARETKRDRAATAKSRLEQMQFDKDLETMQIDLRDEVVQSAITIIEQQLEAD